MRISIYAGMTEELPLSERIELISHAGFDGVMLGFSGEERFGQFELADRAGLVIENVHSPFDRMNALWLGREDSREIEERTCDCIRVSAENGVRDIVVHPTDGLVPPPVTEAGKAAFDRIVDRAVGCGARVLFENIQLPQFLDVLFERYRGVENVGFCYDIGHENCFTKGDDRLRKHGELLRALHIHDNDGASDGHMIPGDGNIDYESFLLKLRDTGFSGAMALELYMNKSTAYRGVSVRDFIDRAFAAGRRLADRYDVLRGGEPE
ncbi:MAG: sugar phosphate isomerase/epimerase [Ruminococcus sp.]|nr:sugar phosphate isomerase/epimerase [Ruminococcus sp.]